METKYKHNLTIDEKNLLIIITRVFDAPRDLVYKVYNDPSLIPQWWGPHEYTTQVEKADVRPGGEWRYIQHNAQGEEFVFYGVYREVVPPERCVYTFNFGGMPGHEIVEAATLEDQGSQTLLTVVDTFQSLEDLYGMLNSGMEKGMAESQERFDALLETAKKQTR